ncbi:MAG: SURF1 family protein [Betaproteobacteria bacterium]
MNAPTARSTRAPASRAEHLFLAAITIAAIVLFVSAGNWQRDRMRAKEAERAAFDAASAVPAATLPRTDEWSAWRYRRVIASGVWRGGAQVLLDNRIHEGRAGFRVVTPLALDDGRAVLVDRGWIAAGAGTARVPSVAAPSGQAAVTGRVILPPRYLELGGGAPSGPVWQNLDPARIGPALGLSLLPIVVEQDPSAPADGLVRQWSAPDTGVTMHRGYMWQWYTFAALAAAAWIGFAVRRGMQSR